MATIKEQIDISDWANSCNSIKGIVDKLSDRDNFIFYVEGKSTLLIKDADFDNFVFNGTGLNSSYTLTFIFDNCEFNCSIDSPAEKNLKLKFINNCTFNKSVRINLHFDNGLTLCDSHLHNVLTIEPIEKSKGEINLINNIYYESTLNLGTAEYTKHVKIEDSEFKKLLPNFRYCQFKNDIDLNLIKIDENKIISQYKNSIKKNKENVLQDLARDLKLKSAARNDHLREMDFFAIESQARAIKDGGFARFISFCYKKLSDFGRSFKRPLEFILFIYLYLFLFNAYIPSNSIEINKTEHFRSVFVFTTKTMLPLTLGFNEDTVKKAKEIVFGKDGPVVLYQTFRLFVVGFNLILWFLFFFAVRNRFKIS